MNNVMYIYSTLQHNVFNLKVDWQLSLSLSLTDCCARADLTSEPVIAWLEHCVVVSRYFVIGFAHLSVCWHIYQFCPWGRTTFLCGGMKHDLSRKLLGFQVFVWNPFYSWLSSLYLILSKNTSYDTGPIGFGIVPGIHILFLSAEL